MDDLARVIAIRSIVYMGEQKCPYSEEFDGNDFTATHVILLCDAEPVGTLRLRWFADWVKLERVCIRGEYRSRDALRAMINAALDFSARKGYRRLIGYIQSRLYPLWTRSYKCRRRVGRTELRFSDFDYMEVEYDIPVHPQVLTPDSSPYVLLRPEGAWDEPGVLDPSIVPDDQVRAAAAA
jgi:hypothetical protein